MEQWEQLWILYFRDSFQWGFIQNSQFFWIYCLHRAHYQSSFEHAPNSWKNLRKRRRVTLTVIIPKKKSPPVRLPPAYWLTINGTRPASISPDSPKTHEEKPAVWKSMGGRAQGSVPNQAFPGRPEYSLEMCTGGHRLRHCRRPV